MEKQHLIPIIVICVLAGLGILALFAYLICLRRKRSKEHACYIDNVYECNPGSGIYFASNPSVNKLPKGVSAAQALPTLDAKDKRKSSSLSISFSPSPNPQYPPSRRFSVEVPSLSRNASRASDLSQLNDDDKDSSETAVQEENGS